MSLPFLKKRDQYISRITGNGANITFDGSSASQNLSGQEFIVGVRFQNPNHVVGTKVIFARGTGTTSIIRMASAGSAGNMTIWAGSDSEARTISGGLTNMTPGEFVEFIWSYNRTDGSRVWRNGVELTIAGDDRNQTPVDANGEDIFLAGDPDAAFHDFREAIFIDGSVAGSDAAPRFNGASLHDAPSWEGFRGALFQYSARTESDTVLGATITNDDSVRRFSERFAVVTNDV